MKIQDDSALEDMRINSKNRSHISDPNSEGNSLYEESRTSNSNIANPT
jgi:hypothetical protein